jgi:fermentation-respiration switch protein FrsA (DUF1100 family)
MRRELKFSVGLFATLVPVAAAAAGMLLASGILHPMRKPLTPEHVKQSDKMLARTGATRDDLTVTAPDGVKLHGWKFRAKEPNGDWVLVYHGVSDNRIGMIGQSELLLRHGYNVAAMDSRAHGASEGDMATYGWLERHDTRAVADALFASEKVHHLFALGSSMGAALALQSAEVESRIAGVVAEAPFADLREVSYDYAGLRISHYLGRTVGRPATWMAIGGAEKEGGFKAEDVSPEKAVAARNYPVFLICGGKDRNIPCRHSQRIYESAKGPKAIWTVDEAGHAAVLGHAPADYERRVLQFLSDIHNGRT